VPSSLNFVYVTGQGQHTQEVAGRCWGKFSIQRRSQRFGNVTYLLCFASCMPASLDPES